VGEGGIFSCLWGSFIGWGHFWGEFKKKLLQAEKNNKREGKLMAKYMMRKKKSFEKCVKEVNFFISFIYFIFFFALQQKRSQRESSTFFEWG